MDVLHELKSLADSDYKAFNAKIIPTQQTTLGVRIPLLRKIAKKLVKEHPIEFVKADKQNVFELILLEGMVLANMVMPFNELLPSTEKFLDKIDNWAQVDTTVCAYKNIADKKEAATNKTGK